MNFVDTFAIFLWFLWYTIWIFVVQFMNFMVPKDGAKVVNISDVGYEFSRYLLIFLVEVRNFSGPRYIFVVFINNEILCLFTNFCGSKYENLYIPF